MMVDWIGFTVASVAVVLAPGPGSMFVAKIAGAEGMQAGHKAMLGIVFGDTCLIILSLLGVSALLIAHPSLFRIIRLGCAGYLVFLGLQSVFSSTRKEVLNDRQKAVLPFRRALGITLFNPKAVFFFMAFFPAFIQTAAGGIIVPYANMTVLFTCISITYLCIVSYVASRLGLIFQESHAIQSAARKICGCLFVGFGIKVAVASR